MEGLLFMNWTIKLYDNEQYLLVTTQGRFSLEEQRKMFQDVTKFSGWCKCKPILFDNRLLELKDTNPEIMRESARINHNFIIETGVQRIAGLVNDGANFGVGRQFAVLFDLVGGNGFRLFKDCGLAVKWLKSEIN